MKPHEIETCCDFSWAFHESDWEKVKKNVLCFEYTLSTYNIFSANTEVFSSRNQFASESFLNGPPSWKILTKMEKSLKIGFAKIIFKMRITGTGKCFVLIKS